MSAYVKNNRWCIFFAGLVINFILAATTAFSVFATPMTKYHGWSMSQFALSFTVYQFAFCITGIFAGGIADKHGAKKIVYVGGALYGLGWYLSGIVQTVPQLYLSYGLLVGMGGGCMYNTTISTTLRWFPEKRGKMSGFLLASASFGPFTLAPIAAMLMNHIGVLPSFKLLGIVFFICIAAVAWMLQSAPADYKPAGWSPSPAESAVVNVNDCNWREMLKSPMFYALFAILVCGSSCGTILISSTAVIAQTQIGLSATVAALTVSIYTIVNLIGRLVFGAIYDKFGTFKALLITLSISTIGMLFIGFTSTLITFAICISLLGFAFGGLLVVFPPITGKTFGMKNLGLNYGIMFMAYAFGAFTGPRICSHFKDTTGSFGTGFFIAAGLGILGIIIVLLVMRSNKAREEIQIAKL